MASKYDEIRRPAQQIYDSTASLAAQNTKREPGLLAKIIVGLIVLGQSSGDNSGVSEGGYEYKPFNPSLDESLMWVQ